MDSSGWKTRIRRSRVRFFRMTVFAQARTPLAVELDALIRAHRDTPLALEGLLRRMTVLHRSLGSGRGGDLFPRSHDLCASAPRPACPDRTSGRGRGDEGGVWSRRSGTTTGRPSGSDRRRTRRRSCACTGSSRIGARGRLPARAPVPRHPGRARPRRRRALLPVGRARDRPHGEDRRRPAPAREGSRREADGQLPAARARCRREPRSRPASSGRTTSIDSASGWRKVSRAS